MNIDFYMLWRFKTIDGVLDNIKSLNFTETIFEDGTKFTYDYVKETVTIDWPGTFKFPKTQVVLFKDMTAENLKHMNFKERTTNRHSNSYIPYNGGFKS